MPSLAAMTDEQVTRLAGDRIAHAMYTWEPYMYNPKLRYRLHRINVPTLLLYGDADRRSPMGVARELEAQIPGARLAVIPGVGHLSNLEAPDSFNREVRSFLASVPD